MSFRKDDAAVGTRSSLRVPTASPKLLIVALLSLSYLTSLIVATHQWAFIINPLQSGDAIRTVELLFFWAGWLLMTVGAAAIALDCLLSSGSSTKYLYLVALVHPMSVIAIQSTLRLRSGHWYLNYLTSNVWFLLSDVAVPVLFWILYRQSQGAMADEADEASSLERVTHE